MVFLLVLGREPRLSLAELEAVFSSESVQPLGDQLALVEADSISLSRLGGTIKAAKILEENPLDYLATLPKGKITLGFSDYSKKATASSTWRLALKYKNLLRRHGRSVRLVPNQSLPFISSATAHHNQLGEKTNHLEIIKYNNYFATSIGTQNITAYAKRDQARPARSAFVGMLPPKLAQILINLAVGTAAPDPKKVLLDPFCGTGVVLQEALLMGFSVLGTDQSEKMINYTDANLKWLNEGKKSALPSFSLAVGDATKHHWPAPIDFIATESYLGQPLPAPPAEIKLQALQDECRTLILSFLKNLAPQIPQGTPLALATPAWLRKNGNYQGLDILDEIKGLGYNLTEYRYARASDLLYFREGQIVARQIIVLRKT